MAKETPKSMRQLVFYQVYNRNHNESGTFKELEQDLERIKNLGTDVLYLLPIHPIGVKDKKGELGCPYSIQNYREVNKEYGTLEDFKDLINKTHEHDMKIMIDVVYNHTSRDSHLLHTHPEWFYRNEKGNFANRVGDWSDITDLDYTQDKALYDELIDTLKYWVSLGIDGFRCDVASLVPLDFWMRAREEVAQMNPNFIWLAESVHGNFVRYIRSMGFEALSDSEVYQAFDICYDYDLCDEYQHYLKGIAPLSDYISKLQAQEYMYPGNYVKLRNLENHDQPRAAQLIPNVDQLLNWTAFNFLQKGAAMIYAGQEAMDTNRPSLFDIDKVNWSRYNHEGIADFITELAKMKKDDIMIEGYYDVLLTEVADVVLITYVTKTTTRVGLFNFGSKCGEVKLEIPDGIYSLRIGNDTVEVKDGKINLSVRPLIFDVKTK